MPTSKFLQLGPSGLLKHPRMGSVQMVGHTLTTWMESWGFIKPLVQNKAVHMKLSLCLCFYLRHSHGGYMVGTAVGFPVEIVEALGPQSHHRTPWKCTQ
jgi:hypothetical protein